MQDFSDAYQQVAALLLSGKSVEAKSVLATVPGALLSKNISPRKVSTSAQLRVFQRDHFVCRYCRRKTVFLPVLRALSAICGPDFPWHPHTKMAECHIAFWRDFASCDHLLPVARGGSSKEENLVTACYMCNSIKQNWLVEELRWTLLPVSPNPWDGLVSFYPSLVERVPIMLKSYHVQWLRTLKQASDTGWNSVEIQS